MSGSAPRTSGRSTRSSWPQAHIEKPPTNYSWAYEMVVADPDGHALRIGSDPKQDVPFND
jgi:hypothetical protein